MSINWQKAGPNHVPSYQMSGVPFVTSSAVSEVNGPDSDSVSIPTKVSFPFVTKWFTIRNTGVNELRLGFSPNGVLTQGERLTDVNAAKATGGSNFYLIPTGSAPSTGNAGGNAGSIQTFELRCKEIYLLSDAAAASNPTTAGNSTSFSLIAGLTTIPASSFPILTGSVNGTSSFDGIG